MAGVSHGDRCRDGCTRLIEAIGARPDPTELDLTVAVAWYGVQIVYEAAVGGTPDRDPMREESIHIVLADSEDQARKRAEEIGRDNQHSYENADGERVTWRFVCVAQVQDLCEDRLTDGMEVFSRMGRRSELE